MHVIKNKITILLFFLFLVGIGKSFGQSTLDLRINEFLVYNDSNYVDDFGEHSPWIEIYNSAYNTINVGGLYLTDDLSNPKKYLIPKGQPITQVNPQGYIVFWADNHTTRGILHLNFSLSEGKIIALFDSNGQTLIDSVLIPTSLKPDITYGRLLDGAKDWGFLEKSTPNSTNDLSLKATSGEKFKEMDPTGAAMAVIAMSVVFIGLALLYLFFKGMARLMKVDLKARREARNALKEKTAKLKISDVDEKDEQYLTGELSAAIAMTLHLYSSELHDAENTVLTINKVSRTYSPWSSKIYTLRKTPN